MKKDFLQSVYSIKSLGYFDGLPNEEEVQEKLKSKYKTANDKSKDLMDNNPNLVLDIYTTGIAQQNFICRKLDNINKILVFFLVVAIINIVASLISIFVFFVQ